MSMQKPLAVALLLAAAVHTAAADPGKSDPLKTLRIDTAEYNPLSLVVKNKHLVEDAVGADLKVEWVPSATPARAVDHLRAHSVDISSATGTSGLLSRVAGNPVKIVYVYAKPDWAAVVVRADSPVQGLADLKGKRVAADSGTDPGMFLLRALATAGLTQHDVTVMPFQSADGRLALDRGQVDAWAGLDPYLAQAEIETHDRVLYRNADLQDLAGLAGRDAFLKSYPEVVEKVIGAYEKARRWTVEHEEEAAQILVAEAKFSPAVADRVLSRADLSDPTIGDAAKHRLAGQAEAMQAAGFLPSDADLGMLEDELLEPQFSRKLARN
jgi:sulfonate transport system substrate-binding protein